MPRYTKIKKQRKKLKPHTIWQTFYFKNEVKLKYFVSFLVSLGMVRETKKFFSLPGKFTPNIYLQLRVNTQCYAILRVIVRTVLV